MDVAFLRREGERVRQVCGDSLVLRHLNRKLNISAAPAAEVRRSVIHGRGVFATRTISQGEVITLYPCDVSLAMDKTRSDEHAWSETMSNTRLHELLNSEFRQTLQSNTLILAGDPELIDDPWFIGHMVSETKQLEHMTSLSVFLD
jgi:hypothetical protein